MAAGLGFKDFTTGEVLTAADVDGYLMQGVWVFASAAARDAAVTSPQEGNFAYLKDTNVTTYYTGSAWANLDTTGMTNPMTTTGDIIYSSSGSTPARLGIGSTGNVLTVAGGVPSWAAPAGGGKVLQVVMGSSNTFFGTTSTSFQDSGLTVSITPTLNTSSILLITSAMSVFKGSQSSNSGVKMQILRGATTIVDLGDRNSLNNQSFRNTGSVANSYLDSPATTSSTTYKLQVAARVSGTDAGINDYDTSPIPLSTMIAIEIGA